MALNLMGKKLGMTQLFNENGEVVVCTVIKVSPNVVTQIKTDDIDGYKAIQLGFDEVIVNKEKTLEARVTKPLLGHFKKAGVAPQRHLLESVVETTENYTVGQQVGIDTFAEIAFIDVIAISKGKGYQGVMKKFNYAGGPAAHGSGFHRHAGSTGMRSTPGRCLPNGKRASQMGRDRKTVQNLKVISVDPTENIIVVKGAVPGARNDLVFIQEALKKGAGNKKKLFR